MEKDRSSKILAIIALVVAVVGLSLGFAAFSQTLTIKSSADVTVDKTDFQNNVKFVTKDGEESGTITADVVGATAGEANLTKTTITDIVAHFTAPGQSVTYKFKVKNESQFDAYLRSVTFKNVTEDLESSPIVCTGIQPPGHYGDIGADQGQVDEACKGIKVTVTVGGESWSATTQDISEHLLGKLTGEEDAEVKIEYETGSSTSDGDFTIAIGDIELYYSSRDKAQ